MQGEKLYKSFGVVALEKGFITSEQLFEAVKIQVIEDIEGAAHRLIGQILRTEGHMTTAQIDEVVSALQPSGV